MSAKQIVYEAEARQLVLKGVEKLSRAVKSTLGPRGRTVVLEKKFGSPTITKDGVVVTEIKNAGTYILTAVGKNAIPDILHYLRKAVASYMRMSVHED